MRSLSCPVPPRGRRPAPPLTSSSSAAVRRHACDRHCASAERRQRLFHDHELDGARQQLVGTLRYRSPPPRGPVSNSRSWSHSVNTSGLYSSLTSPNAARGAPARRGARPFRRGNPSCTPRSTGTRRARRRRRAPPSRRAPRPPPRPRTSGPTARQGTRPGRSSASTCRRSCPRRGRRGRGGGPPGTACPHPRPSHRAAPTAGGSLIGERHGARARAVREPRVCRVVRDVFRVQPDRVERGRG